MALVAPGAFVYETLLINSLQETKIFSVIIFIVFLKYSDCCLPLNLSFGLYSFNHLNFSLNNY